MSEQVIIDERFRGPPDSANGGYTCGIVAGLVGGTAEVTLRRPPPVGRSLKVERLDGGGVALLDGEAVVAEAAPASVELDVPDPVDFAEAEQAARSYPLFEGHPFPMCFVCGPDRGEGDGLRIFPGRVEGRDIVAAPWMPNASVAGGDGTVQPEIVWAALDCPGGFAFGFSEKQVILLGRLAAKLIVSAEIGERYVATGWSLGSDGRKVYAGSALFSQDGTLCAVARATWIKVP